jgi:hypothetical protein
MAQCTSTRSAALRDRVWRLRFTGTSPDIWELPRPSNRDPVDS